MILSNSFLSPRYYREPYNYQSNLICNLKLSKLLSIIEVNLQVCSKCNLRKKNHYCIQPKCKNKQLICPQCDITKIDQNHYMHDYTYILPLLSKDIFTNFHKLKKKIINFHEDIIEEIKKLQSYLDQLMKIQGMVLTKIENLDNEQQLGKIKNYIQKMQAFISEKRGGEKLSDIINNVHFKSAQQCLLKQQQIKNEILINLNNLKWPKQPQKVLKEKLKFNYEDEKKEIFISAYKCLQITQIDSHFKANHQFYTENMENHPVEIKLDSDYLAKPKFYESFIYHFRNCKRLCIDNGNMSHLRTPIAFRNLKDFQFNFNVQMQPQNIKIQSLNEKLVSLTFRRFRQEDIRILKNIIISCTSLKKIHLQFHNKIDLYNFKQLVQCLKYLKNNVLTQFTLKIRTQSEVKRLYGYLSKFYKDLQSSQSNINLNSSIIEILEQNKMLTKVVIEGVKPLNMNGVSTRLKALSNLMDYKIYYQNVDLMTQVEEKQVKQLQAICFKRKRIFYALAKSSKEKILPKTIINHIVGQMLV